MVEVGGKTAFKKKKKSFLEKTYFLKSFCYTTLYFLDLLRFGPKFGIFHIAKVPCYKRVKWGQLAGPSVIH